jgi:hypothetical protein
MQHHAVNLNYNRARQSILPECRSGRRVSQRGCSAAWNGGESDDICFGTSIKSWSGRLTVIAQVAVGSWQARAWGGMIRSTNGQTRDN